jgi:hypothetical protein
MCPLLAPFLVKYKDIIAPNKVEDKLPPNKDKN